MSKKSRNRQAERFTQWYFKTGKIEQRFRELAELLCDAQLDINSIMDEFDTNSSLVHNCNKKRVNDAALRASYVMVDQCITIESERYYEACKQMLVSLDKQRNMIERFKRDLDKVRG